jgi:hypothetical protein
MPSALPWPAYPAKVLKVRGCEYALGAQANIRPLTTAAQNETWFITGQLSSFREKKQLKATPNGLGRDRG